jgi:hypothetical protein
MAVDQQLNLDQPSLRRLLAKGRREGCIELSELSEAVEELELDESGVQTLQQELEALRLAS